MILYIYIKKRIPYATTHHEKLPQIITSLAQAAAVSPRYESGTKSTDRGTQPQSRV